MKLLNNILATAVCVTMLSACSRSSDSDAPAPADPPKQEPKTACQMVSAEQMSAILGSTVTAEPISDSVGKTDCNYAPKEGSMPMAQLSIEYGSAEAAMTAGGMLGRIEPGMTNPYEGLGDQAAAIGPAVWIRQGDDLVIITVFGVDASDAAVKRIYELVAVANKP